MTSTYEFTQVDVFTSCPFGGNQLAVFTDAQGLTTDEMQTLAQEMNYAESTFVLPAEQPDAVKQVRIFTPKVELPMAGHPTIGTSYVLAADGTIPLNGETTDVMLELGIGPIGVRIEQRDGIPSFVWMTQPAPTFEPVRDDRKAIADAVGVTEADLIDTLPIQVVSTGVPFLFVPLESLDAVARGRSDASALSALFTGSEPRPVYLFSLQTHAPEAQIHARMFAPHCFGIAEDPATGSAAGPLGAYLAHYGVLPTSPSEYFMIEQGIEMGRPSEIHVEVRREGEEFLGPRVGGQAVIVGKGIIFWE